MLSLMCVCVCFFILYISVLYEFYNVYRAYTFLMFLMYITLFSLYFRVSIVDIWTARLWSFFKYLSVFYKNILGIFKRQWSIT